MICNPRKAERPEGFLQRDVHPSGLRQLAKDAFCIRKVAEVQRYSEPSRRFMLLRKRVRANEEKVADRE